MLAVIDASLDQGLQTILVFLVQLPFDDQLRFGGWLHQGSEAFLLLRVLVDQDGWFLCTSHWLLMH